MEHVPQDHIPLDRAQGKVPLGVLQRPGGVVHPVPAVAGILMVPIVEKIVVQQGAAHQCALIGPDMQAGGDGHADQRHGEGVTVYTDMRCV